MDIFSLLRKYGLLTALLFILLNIFVKGQTQILSQNFESAWSLPADIGWSDGGATGDAQWHQNSFTSGWNNPSSGAYTPTGANTTSQSARFHSMGLYSGTSGTLITPAMDFSATSGSKRLVFYYNNTNGKDSMEIYLSTDDGVTYGSRIAVFTTSLPWDKYSIDLGSSNSSTVKIKFVAYSDRSSTSNTDIGIDECSVYGNLSPLSGMKNIPGDYLSITAAMDAMLVNTISGPVVFELGSTYACTNESFPVKILNVPNSSATNTVTFRPAMGATPVISCSLSVSAVAFYNAKYVTFDGRQGGTSNPKSWIIQNSSILSSAYTVSFFNSSTNNTLRYMDIRGACQLTKLEIDNFGIGPGVVFFGTSLGSGSGNNYNTINNCDVRNASSTSTDSLPMNLITSYTQTSANGSNNYNTISNNNFFNYQALVTTTSTSSSAILIVSIATGWTITGNSIYQQSQRCTTLTTFGAMNTGIYMSTGNHSITGNYFGGSGPQCSGSPMTYYSLTGVPYIYGVMQDQGAVKDSVITISNNTFKNISLTTVHGASGQDAAFIAINLISSSSQAITNITGNTIGSVSDTGSIRVTNYQASGPPNRVTGIVCQGAGVVTISNNTIGSITAVGGNAGIGNGVYGISYSSGAGIYTISNNLIGSLTVPNSINLATVYNGSAGAAQSFIGFNIGSTTATSVNLSNNTVCNINNAGTSRLANCTGIQVSTQNATISGNTIRKLYTASAPTSAAFGSATITGMSVSYASTTGGITVTGNTIDSLFGTATHAASGITGISVTGSQVGVPLQLFEKNMLNTFVLSSNNDSSKIYGIYTASSATFGARNNIIRLGVDSTGIAHNTTYYGIYEANSATCPSTYFYNNDVYLGGLPPTSASSYAFFSAATAYTTATQRTFLNNIFYNARTGGTGKHYATKFTGSATTGVNPAGLINNFSIYGTGSTASPSLLNGYYTTDYTSLNSWQAGLGKDVNSLNAYPGFTDPDGYALFNMHINPANSTPVEANGIAISGLDDDFYGNTRGNLTPSDIGAEAGNFTASVNTPPSIVLTALGSITNTVSRILADVIITSPVGVNSTAGTKPRVYYKKNWDADTLIDNTSNSDGWKYVEANGTTSPFDFTLDYTLLDSGNVAAGTTIQYFVIAQDMSDSPKVAQSSGVFAVAPASVALTTTNFPVGSSVASYQIVSGISGFYEVGSGKTFTSLTANATTGFFKTINSGIVTGNVTVSITSDLTENGAVGLMQWAEEGAGNYTLTIQPDATTVRTISNNAVNLTVPLLQFNGADRVTIDGRYNGGGKYLRFLNTHTTAASCQSALHFTNGSQNCVVRNDSVVTNSLSSSQANILIGASASTGSNSITIDSCEIKEANNTTTTGTPYHGIYALNAVANTNTVSVTNCNVYNFSAYGIRIANAGSGTTVTGNSLYNNLVTTMINSSPTAILVGHNTSNPQAGYTVSNNYIGGSAPLCGGNPLIINATTSSAGFTGINVVQAVLNPAASIQNNTIKKISLRQIGTTARSTAFTGITTSGNVNIGTVTGNIIGDDLLTDSIHVTGSGNIVGITATGTGAAIAIENNIIANCSNNIAIATTSPTFNGINTGGISTTRNNKIHHIYTTSNSTTTHTGINFSTVSLGSLIENNKIYNININPITPSIVASVAGITISGSAAVSKNVIYDLINTAVCTLATAVPTIFGIRVGSGTPAFAAYNNMISLGSYGGAPITNKLYMFGIYDVSTYLSTNTYYYNTIIINGTSSTGTINDTTYCYARKTADQTPAAIILKNNILDNSRGGSGVHYSVANATLYTSNWTPANIDYNILNSASPSTVGQWIWGAAPKTFTAWKEASAGDSHSKSGISLTFDPAALANGIYHVSGNTRGNKNLTGTPVSVEEDYDGQARHSLYPYIGADEDIVKTLVPPVINLKVYIEGLTNNSGVMVEDTCTVFLNNTWAPNAVVDSVAGVLDASGNGVFSFKGLADQDSTYYLSIKHRNSIETWSASGNAFTSAVLNYDMTSAANKAYGSNLILKGSYYCIYSGDVNQDGIVDFSDLTLVDNDSYTFASGYLATDVNGDQFVDFSDLTLVDNNSYNFIGVVKPGLNRNTARPNQIRKHWNEMK